MATERPLIDGSKYCSCREGSLLLGGLVTPETLSRMARHGELRGAFKAAHKIWLLRASLRDVIEPYRTQELLVDPTLAPVERPPVWHDRRAHVTLDGFLDDVG